ncbi:MAG TPA: hypothetical protein VGU61_12105 [Noviherbaspirillum sp.]|nr:hypothetical protein [Noviherbaspirillum sp.]HEV2611002.1 hypothetical protein [Noviherbaspirillum sp.]
MRSTKCKSHATTLFLQGEAGESNMEYALIGLLVVVVGILVLLALGKSN